MPRRRRRRPTDTSTRSHAAEAAAVPLIRRIPNARTVGIGIGLARVGIGAIFFAAPVTALRIVGVDSATAARVTWLSRMTAARDGVLGAGTVQSAATGGGAGWLMAGAVSDAVDAVALAQAVRERRAGGLGATGMVVAACATSALGVWAALGSRPRRRQLS